MDVLWVLHTPCFPVAAAHLPVLTGRASLCPLPSAGLVPSTGLLLLLFDSQLGDRGHIRHCSNPKNDPKAWSSPKSCDFKEVFLKGDGIIRRGCFLVRELFVFTRIAVLWGWRWGSLTSSWLWRPVWDRTVGQRAVLCPLKIWNIPSPQWYRLRTFFFFFNLSTDLNFFFLFSYKHKHQHGFNRHHVS